MKRTVLLCLFFTCLLAGNALAQESSEERGTLTGTVFGDFYWIPMNHTSSLEGANGFWIRRIYLTYDRQISESFFSRVRLEMNSEGDFFTNSKMIPEVKDAFLKWNNESYAIFAGISSTPTWGTVEDVWSYRSLGKTPLDLQKLGSSRDFGISLQGSLGEGEKLDYHLMAGNGNGTRPELNEGKKVMLSLGYEGGGNVIAEIYGDYNQGVGDNHTYTMQGFVGYESEGLNAGMLFARQIRERGTGLEDKTLNIASLFTHFSMSDNTRGILRVDHMFDPNPAGAGIDYIPFSTQAKSTLLIAGLDFLFEEKVHLIPNIEMVFYGEGEGTSSPDSDLIGRLTLSYNF